MWWLALLSRFNDSYDATWSVSDVSSSWSHRLTVSTCNMDAIHGDSSVDRLLQRLLDASHADTTRYHVTDSTMSSYSDDERPRPDNVVPEVESAAAWLEEYWSQAWTLFITLDMLLLSARATVTYVNATGIYHRGGGLAYLQAPAYHQPAVHAVNHCIANGQVGSTARPSSTAKADDRASRQSTWSPVVDTVCGRSLLIVVHLSSLVVLLYLAARVATSSAAVDVIVDVIHDVYTRQVRAHLSLSEAVVREQSQLTTSSLMQSAQQFDLLALRVFDQYFRLGNRCLRRCYASFDILLEPFYQILGLFSSFLSSVILLFNVFFSSLF